jgi:putative nucleotidyltransferase with HDIG domain
MIDRIDKAMLALQAAFTARKLYGVEHAVVQRQLDLACETLTALLGERGGGGGGGGGELRLVRLENTLVFGDLELPSCALLTQALTPRLVAHGIEWIEFRSGLTSREVVTLLEQLERSPAELLRSGTVHIRVGRVGRSDAADADATVQNGTLAADNAVSQFRGIWQGLHGDGSGGAIGRPDQRLGELVESIRLAVAVGADVCRQLADVKSHDEYTFVHTVNVGILSAALGEAVGMKPNQVFDLTLAALLHDVGKQHTPLAILNKPGKLDDGERKQMELHTTTGAAMLLARRGVPDVAPIVAFEHHANVDGSGYPHLRRNPRPHLASQIVHVADVFDALRTNRPYRAAMDDAAVRAILLQGAGKSFDAALTDLFLERVISPKPGKTKPATPPPPRRISA